MKTKHGISVIVCIFLWVGIAAAEPVTVRGVGFGADGDLAAARDAAIEDARIRAVEQTLGVVVDARTAIHRSLMVGDTLITRTKGAVTDFRIIAEGPGDFGLYTVTITADVSAETLVDEAIKAGDNDKALTVYCRESIAGKPAGGQGIGKGGASGQKNDAVDTGGSFVLGPIETVLSRGGLTVVRSQAMAAHCALAAGGSVSALARQTGTGFVVIAASDETAPRCQTANFCHAAGEGRVRLFDGRTGGLMLSRDTEPQRGFGNQPQEALARLRKNTGKALGEMLSEALLVELEKEVRVEIDGLPDAATYEKLKRVLGTLRWVDRVAEDTVGYHPARSVLLVTYRGDRTILAAMLGKLGGYGFEGRTGGTYRLVYGKTGN